MDTTATLDSLKTVVTYCFSLCGEVVTTIASQPLLLIPVGLMMAGGGIGLAKRLIGR
ncbi:MAG: hypothetical protein ACI4C7_08185 [Clostridia bacterium]